MAVICLKVPGFVDIVVEVPKGSFCEEAAKWRYGTDAFPIQL
jgi:hypothetical protein